MLKLIPFNPEWVAHETLDVHAIYRRPVRTFDGEVIRDADGFIQWDLTTPLPIHGHNKWVAKGFEYVTLAGKDDVIAVADEDLANYGVRPLGSRPGEETPDAYLGQGPGRGPWNAQQYLADLKAERDTRAARLRDFVTRLGPDDAEAMERERDPAYVLPAALRQSAPPDPPKSRRRKRVDPEPVAA